MKVKQLKKLIKHLNPEMDVVMIKDEDNLGQVCFENSEVVEVMDELNGDKFRVLLLVPCTCHTEVVPELLPDQQN